MKYLITTDIEKGFKVSFQAETEEEVSIAKELTKLLIEKIEKIKIEIKAEEY